MNREILWYPSGYTSYTFTQKELQFLHDEAEDILLKPHDYTPWNDNLVGQIEKEYKLSNKTKDKLCQLLLPWCQSYYEIFPYYPSIKSYTNLPLKFALNDAWINFQSKYEYNPLHTHNGVFSFVIWLKIPFKYEDEIKTPHVRNSLSRYKNPPGGFTIYSIDSQGKIQPNFIKPNVNDGVLFPADMAHSVNPFYTSDDYRISVSGNFMYDM